MNPPREARGAFLVVSGEPVVGRALALLLRSLGYEAKFVAVSSLGETRELGGARLLVLAPTPELNAERRDAFFASVRETVGAARMPVLELVETSEEQPEEERTRAGSWYEVPWPTSIEELRGRIEDALSGNPT